MSGTKVEVEVVRVVDGDTVRVDNGTDEESLRILALDTEESNAGGSKPVTPWGRAASDRAKEVFSPGDRVSVEFPGNEPAQVCWQKYRGNFGRALVYIYDKDDRNFQEIMIREGFSPYFMKYGYAHFPAHHARYQAAEREAQIAHRGLWDQHAVNQAEMRNYARLGLWWDLRARIIEGYRAFKAAHPDAELFNSRLDYARLVELAEAEAHGVVFTELRDLRRIGGDNGLIGIGSEDQPFKVFLPDLDQPAGQAVVHLLENRYLSGDDQHPRRGYAYVQGPMKMFRDRPELVVARPEQISDQPPD